MHAAQVVAGVERPALFGAAGVGGEGAVREEGQDDFGLVESVFDFAGPDIAAVQSTAVKPGGELAGLEVGMEPGGELVPSRWA